jgi:glycine/D-amino acid oxidase-like deaminating enzyme/nitrite reductase/ring-hydroxylating ferredoxin subunit
MSDRTASPYWTDTASMPRFSRLDRDLRVDVVVVGGGITGATAAYLIKRSGRTVALLDRGRPGGGDTGHTTAHLTCVTDLRLRELVDRVGEDHARAVWDAGLAAIAQIDAIVRDHQIDCGFTWVPGYLHAPPSEGRNHDSEVCREEAELAERLGFDAAFTERVPFFDRPGIRYDDQARFHPARYLAALLAEVDGNGGYVFEDASVTGIEDDPLTVVSGRHRLRCRDVVIATHNPIVGVAGLVAATFLQTKLFLYTTYAVGGQVPTGTLPDALYWDTADPYRYVRIDARRGVDYVIVGGEDHKTGQEPDTRAAFDRLERYARQILPELDVTHRWSGQVIETADGLPYIGAIAPHQHIATGFSGNGMTFGTLGGMMAADAIAGRANPWRDLFAATRTGLRHGLWDYVKENKDYPYYMLRDRFAGVDGRSLRSVRRGSGKILSLNGSRVAAFRDADGTVTVKSATCTHMGCQVQWNAAERTWDCPCHGSRFSPQGDVLSGPAETPLADVPERPH